MKALYWRFGEGHPDAGRYRHWLILNDLDDVEALTSRRAPAWEPGEWVVFDLVEMDAEQPPAADPIAVPAEMDAGETLAWLGTDAERWAAMYAQVYNAEYGHDDTASDAIDPEPGGLTHGYFCNAIGAGETAGYGKAMTECYGPEWPSVRHLGKSVIR